MRRRPSPCRLHRRSLSFAAPAARSTFPSRFRSSLSVRSPAASLIRPLASSVLAYVDSTSIDWCERLWSFPAAIDRSRVEDHFFVGGSSPVTVRQMCAASRRRRQRRERAPTPHRGSSKVLCVQQWCASHLHRAGSCRAGQSGATDEVEDHDDEQNDHEDSNGVRNPSGSFRLIGIRHSLCSLSIDWDQGIPRRKQALNAGRVTRRSVLPCGSVREDRGWQASARGQG